MNYKSTLVLLILVAALGVYFFATPEKPVPPVEEPEAGGPGATARPGSNAGKPVLEGAEWNLQKIDGVGFSDGRQVMVARREGEDWMLKEPVRWRMNEHDIPNLINVATGVRYFDKMNRDANLKDLRLEPAAVTITLFPKEGKEPMVLEVGRMGVAGAGYLKIKGKPDVYVVEDSLHRLVLDRDATDWRSQSLAGAPGPERADTLSVKQQGGGFEIKRIGGRWTIVQPERSRADQDAVNAFVYGLGRAYAAKFIEDKPADLARYGLDKPQAVIQVSQPGEPGKDGAKEGGVAAKAGTLSIGSATDLTSNHYYAMWSSLDNTSTVVFTLAKLEAEKYIRPVENYRDRRLVNLPLSDITRVKAAFGKDEKPMSLSDEAQGGYALRLDKDSWVFDDAKGVTAGGPGLHLPSAMVAASDGKTEVELKPDTLAVNTMLNRLVNAKATAFEKAEESAQSGKRIGVVELVGVGGLNKEALGFYEHDPESLKVLRMTADKSGAMVSEPVAMIVPRKELTGLMVTREQLLDRSLINVVPAQVVRLEIDRMQSAYPAKYVISRVTGEKPGDEKWVFEDGSQAEVSAVSRILDLTAPLRASGRNGKVSDKPGSVIRFALVSKEGQRFEYGVTPGAGEGEAVLFTGTVPGKDAKALPTAPRGLIAALEGEVRSRSMLPVSADQIATVTINPTTDLITLNQGNKGSYRNPDGKLIDPTKVGPMFDTLAGLRAERILETPKEGVEGELKREFVIQTRDGAKWTLKVYLSRTIGVVGVLSGPVRADSAGKTGEMKVFKLSQPSMDRLSADVIAKVKRAPEGEQQE